LPKLSTASLAVTHEMPAITVSEGRVFHTLDALRGIAAVGVVAFHMKALFVPITVAGGYLAVDLFFVMSGVVLSHAYEARFLAGMGTFDFMRARLIRLYPLYLLGTVLGILVTVASLLGHNIGNWDSWSLAQVAVPALVLLPNVSARPVNEMFPLNIPCWSLFLEVLVNLLFVVAWPWLTSRRLVVVSLLAGGAVGFAIVRQGSIDQGSIAASFAVGLARAMFGFSVGILIARRIPHPDRRESNLRVLAIAVIVGIALVARPEGLLRVTWDAACVLVIFPLVVWFGTLIDPGPRLRRVATFLGATSYAIYVLHSPLSSILNSATRHFAGPGGGGAPFTGIAFLIVLLGGCWVIDRQYDMPIRRLLSRAIPTMQSLRTQS
jgi:peptidoglycan/LPS O-acetylase OafA/YrhL